MRRCLIALIALAGCGPDADHFQIQWVLERGASQMCPSDNCELISMDCDAAVRIRIADDADDSVHYTECFRVEGGTDLCALESIDLGAREIPNTMVRIQVAIWPYTEATADCPEVEFDLAGQIASATETPAIAGQAYFEVGSSTVAPVNLWCIDVATLDTACQTTGTIHVSSLVTDFATRLSVPPQVGPRLTVTVGEPRFDSESSRWTLNSADTATLTRTVVSPTPRWEADVDLDLQAAACLQVIEDATQAAATIRCVVPDDAATLDAPGMFVGTATLDLVQQAIGDLPEEGLVLGYVVDHDNELVPGVTVTGSNAALVEYLSDDLTSVVAGATVTSSSGVFIARGVPFATFGEGVTTWEAQVADLGEQVIQVGGCVEGKVTIIVLELQEPGTKG